MTSEVPDSRPPPVPSRKPRKLVVVLVGRTGAGKSSLGNCLLGYSAGDSKAPFAVSPGAVSCTTEVSTSDGYFLGYKDRPIEVVDTPGLADTEGRDSRFHMEVVERLQAVRRIHVILWVRNAQDRRIDENEKKSIKLIAELFGNCILENSVLCFTNYSFDSRSRRQRKQQGRSLETLASAFWKELLSSSNNELENAYSVEEMADIDQIPLCALDACRDINNPQEEAAFQEQAVILWNAFELNKQRPVRELKYLFGRLDEIRTRYEEHKQTLLQKDKELEKLKEELARMQQNLGRSVPLTDSPQLPPPPPSLKAKDVPPAADQSLKKSSENGPVESFPTKPDGALPDTANAPEYPVIPKLVYHGSQLVPRTISGPSPSFPGGSQGSNFPLGRRRSQTPSVNPASFSGPPVFHQRSHSVPGISRHPMINRYEQLPSAAPPGLMKRSESFRGVPTPNSSSGQPGLSSPPPPWFHTSTQGAQASVLREKALVSQGKSDSIRNNLLSSTVTPPEGSTPVLMTSRPRPPPKGERHGSTTMLLTKDPHGFHKSVSIEDPTSIDPVDKRDTRRKDSALVAANSPQMIPESVSIGNPASTDPAVKTDSKRTELGRAIPPPASLITTRVAVKEEDRRMARSQSEGPAPKDPVVPSTTAPKEILKKTDASLSDQPNTSSRNAGDQKSVAGLQHVSVIGSNPSSVQSSSDQRRAIQSISPRQLQTERSQTSMAPSQDAVVNLEDLEKARELAKRIAKIELENRRRQQVQEELRQDLSELEDNVRRVVKLKAPIFLISSEAPPGSMQRSEYFPGVLTPNSSPGQPKLSSPTHTRDSGTGHDPPGFHTSTQGAQASVLREKGLVSERNSDSIRNNLLSSTVTPPDGSTPVSMTSRPRPPPKGERHGSTTMLLTKDPHPQGFHKNVSIEDPTSIDPVDKRDTRRKESASIATNSPQMIPESVSIGNPASTDPVAKIDAKRTELGPAVPPPASLTTTRVAVKEEERRMAQSQSEGPAPKDPVVPSTTAPKEILKKKTDASLSDQPNTSSRNAGAQKSVAGLQHVSVIGSNPSSVQSSSDQRRAIQSMSPRQLQTERSQTSMAPSKNAVVNLEDMEKARELAKRIAKIELENRRRQQVQEELRQDLSELEDNVRRVVKLKVRIFLVLCCLLVSASVFAELFVIIFVYY